MAKGYENTEQAFGVGDIALLTEKDGKQWKVKIMEVWQDDDDNYGYLVLPAEFESRVARDIPQSMLDFI